MKLDTFQYILMHKSINFLNVFTQTILFLKIPLLNGLYKSCFLKAYDLPAKI